MILTTLTIFYNSIYYAITFLLTFFIYLHSVLPFGLDVGILGVAAYFYTKLPKPESNNVSSIFGPEAGSKESEKHPDRVIKCIAHRGAGLDAPENTMQAFKYCVAMECNFVEMDVRSSRDGQLVLLHDQGLERLTGTDIADVRIMDWDSIKNINVGATHPNRQHYKDVTLCLLDDAIDYLLANKVRMIIDVKGEDKQVINGILRVFSSNPILHEYAVVTTFNPFILYQIRKKDPNIVGAISYRPYCFSALNYDAENGPTNPRFAGRLAMQVFVRFLDVIHSALWRWTARWCSVSAVLLHKDIVSPREVEYWRGLGIRVAGWCVNRPVEKLYWRAVLRAPYLANTLMGEPEIEKKVMHQDEYSDPERPIRTMELEKKLSSGQN